MAVLLNMNFCLHFSGKCTAVAENTHTTEAETAEKQRRQKKKNGKKRKKERKKKKKKKN